MVVQATYVIPWQQIEIDGLAGAELDSIALGSNWRSLAAPLYLFGKPSEEACSASRASAARTIEKLIGKVPQRPSCPEPQDEAPPNSITLTDGLNRYTASLLQGSQELLVMFQGQAPQADHDYWVSEITLNQRPDRLGPQTGRGVICFAEGTYLRTPLGSKRIEAFRPGDLLQTQDNGVKPVLWCGKRHMSGARLHVMPHLRPIRFHSGALGQGRPLEELLVSPQHRMLVTGAMARDLFGTDEVLISAKDLIDGKGVQIAASLRAVTYHHLLLEEHQIVFANGLASESFHPAMADFDTMMPEDQKRLLHLLPKVAQSPDLYGQHARRSLSPAEASILHYQLRA